MTRIYTAPHNYGGPDRVDITFSHVEDQRTKGQPTPIGACLAPSAGLRAWTKMYFYEHGGDTDENRRRMWPEYSHRYREEIRARYAKNRELFVHLLRRSAVVLVCFCKDHHFCHRSLAAEYLAKASDGHASYDGEISGGGDLLAATLWPEWAYAYAYLGKNVENRGWRAERALGMWIGIHGGKCIGGIQHPEDMIRDEHLDALAAMLDMAAHVRGQRFTVTAREVLNHGRGIVALAKVERFIYGKPQGWYVGRPQIGWSTPHVIVLDAPVRCRGDRGLWPVPAEIRMQVAERLPNNAPEDLVRQLAA